ncbi:EF-Hand 1, calcium-binding site-containing protein [Artemisia annua]|uniref:EF-Hand 1, calcium-binding site-containing protein n=1 Tax=Artemisia annua TaxID=35608 RepID=A0A2U1MKU2_ARTAN|nr:EF-Hand 1, calcium-binding site-containing protein [Artemisia annua]
MAEYIEQGKPLGGLLLLLPQILCPEKSETVGGHDDKENLKKQLVDLEQKLIHTTINQLILRCSSCMILSTKQYLDMVLKELTSSFDVSLAIICILSIKRNDAAGQPATATTGGYKLIVSSPAPKKLSSPTITNIQASICRFFNGLSLLSSYINNRRRSNQPTHCKLELKVEEMFAIEASIIKLDQLKGYTLLACMFKCNMWVNEVCLIVLVRYAKGELPCNCLLLT